MTIEIYPAYLNVRNFEHADDWSDETTVRMSAEDFFGFFTKLMGEQNVPGQPGYWSTKFVADSLRNATFADEKWTPIFNKLVAQAEVLRASHICYA